MWWVKTVIPRKILHLGRLYFLVIDHRNTTCLTPAENGWLIFNLQSQITRGETHPFGLLSNKNSTIKTASLVKMHPKMWQPLGCTLIHVPSSY